MHNPPSRAQSSRPAPPRSSRIGKRSDIHRTPRLRRRRTDIRLPASRRGLGVANQDRVAAPIASSVLARIAERGAVDMDNLRIAFESRQFPTTAFGVAHNLDPALRLLIEKAFFTFDFEGNSVGDEFQDADRFTPITCKTNWQVIRNIQEQNEVDYTTETIEG